MTRIVLVENGESLCPIDRKRSDVLLFLSSAFQIGRSRPDTEIREE